MVNCSDSQRLCDMNALRLATPMCISSLEPLCSSPLSSLWYQVAELVMSFRPAMSCARAEELQGLLPDDATPVDPGAIFCMEVSPVVLEGVPVQDSWDPESLFDTEGSPMFGVVYEDVAACAPPTPPAPVPVSPVIPLVTCGSTYGSRCMLPGPSRPKCSDLCTHPVGHCGLCACHHHDLDPFTGPIIRVSAVQAPGDQPA